MHLEWWQWVVCAVGMTMLELVIHAWVLIWFAASALLVALVTLIYPPLPAIWQLIVWLIAAVAMMVWWFRVRKPVVKDESIS